MVAHVIFYFFSRFNKTTAWLRSLSFAPKHVRQRSARFSPLASIPPVLSSSPTPPAAHRSGLCPNHLRGTALGAISFMHRSTCAFSLLTPRGHNRSTSKRHPPFFLAGS